MRVIVIVVVVVVVAVVVYFLSSLFGRIANRAVFGVSSVRARLSSIAVVAYVILVNELVSALFCALIAFKKFFLILLVFTWPLATIYQNSLCKNLTLPSARVLFL